MEQLTIYRNSKNEKEVFYIPSWYCKPSILGSIALCLHYKPEGCLFVSCSKYGCRQFTPRKSKVFPVDDVAVMHYQGWYSIFPIFSDKYASCD